MMISHTHIHLIGRAVLGEPLTTIEGGPRGISITVSVSASSHAADFVGGELCLEFGVLKNVVVLLLLFLRKECIEMRPYC